MNRAALVILPSLFFFGACADTMRKEPNTMTTTAAQPTAKMLLDAKGSGAPVVLVGGGLTGWASWVPVQERLSATRTAIRAQPLTVQYGLENRPVPEGYSIRYESRALAGALDDAKLGAPIDLVAWSFGALVSLDFALEHPDRIRTLTLIEPPAFWVLDAARTRDAESTRESDAMRAPRAAMKDDVTEEQLAQFVCLAGLCPNGADPHTLPSWPSWVKHRRSLRTQEAEWRHHDDAARLRAFDRPVLLVKGTGSSHFLHRIVDGLAATLPRAELVELPGGHAPQIVAESAFLDRLAKFQRL